MPAPRSMPAAERAWLSRRARPLVPPRPLLRALGGSLLPAGPAPDCSLADAAFSSLTSTAFSPFEPRSIVSVTACHGRRSVRALLDRMVRQMSFRGVAGSSSRIRRGVSNGRAGRARVDHHLDGLRSLRILLDGTLDRLSGTERIKAFGLTGGTNERTRRRHLIDRDETPSRAGVEGPHDPRERRFLMSRASRGCLPHEQGGRMRRTAVAKKSRVRRRSSRTRAAVPATPCWCGSAGRRRTR